MSKRNRIRKRERYSGIKLFTIERPSADTLKFLEMLERDVFYPRQTQSFYEDAYDSHGTPVKRIRVQ